MNEWEKCPFCGSHSVWGYNFFNRDEEGNIWRNMTCRDCNCQWNEVYNFSHKEDIVTCAKLEDKE